MFYIILKCKPGLISPQTKPNTFYLFISTTQISFWLIENGFTVLIAACDTFRAGAVEQLRTHQRRLNSLHPPEQHGGRPMVQLYEKGYGKDAAGIAMEAIAYGRGSLSLSHARSLSYSCFVF